MKYCSKCGKELFDEAIFCPGCGCGCEKKVKEPKPETSKLATRALTAAFTIPILGLILGIIGASKYRNPSYKKRCIAAIVISIIVQFVLLVFMGMLMGMQ